MNQTCKEMEILLVEDNPGDVLLTREALQEGKVSNNLHCVRDGIEALAFLNRKNPFADAPRPDVIFLDLNLPRKNGYEVLSIIKSDSNLRRIPVVILTSSKAEKDVLYSYDQHANCFITKPVDLEKFMSVVQTIDHFWVKIATLPDNGNEP